MKALVFLATLLLVLTATASAETDHYTIRDEDGKVLYDVVISQQADDEGNPIIPDLGAFIGFTISVNGVDGKPAEVSAISISGFDDTSLRLRSVAGMTGTVRGIYMVDICVDKCSRTRDVAKFACSINGRGPLIYEWVVSHRMPYIDYLGYLSSMSGTTGFSGMASASVGGGGEWTTIGNIIYAMLDTNMDATASCSAGFQLDTSIAGVSCSTASGGQVTTGDVKYPPFDGCVLPSLYTLTKSSSLTVEARIYGVFNASPGRRGSANAGASLFCPSAEKPCEKRFSQAETSQDFSESESSYVGALKEEVKNSSTNTASEYVTGTADSGATMTAGEGGAFASGSGKFRNLTTLTAGIWSKPPVTEP